MKSFFIFFLMTAGTVGATLGVARTDPSVENWETRLQAHLPLTAASLAVLALGVVLRQVGARAVAQTAHGQRLGTAGLASSLDRLAAELDQLAGAFTDEATRQETPVLSAALLERLEGPLKGSLQSAVAGCLGLRTSHGSAAYAHVMGPLARGERALNRAWSSAADGYLEEAESCVQQARAAIEETRAVLGEIA